jgi:hypothetical protein
MKSDKKLFIKFRPFFVFIVIVLTFVSCFAAYMLDANENEDEYIAKWERINIKEVDSDKDVDEVDVINPVPLSERKDGTYITHCVFLGDIIAENMKNYFGNTENTGVYYYIFFSPTAIPTINDLSEFNIKGEENTYICAVPPIAAAAETSKLSNKTIDLFNSSLLNFANSNDLLFLDTNTLLKAEDGKLSPQFYSSDYSLNSNAYEALREYFLTHTVLQ